MNILIVPLIGPEEDAWLTPAMVSLSNVDNFCRLFLPPPDSETRKKASECGELEAEETAGGDQRGVADGWHPNGFLVVDAAGELRRRIGLFILRTLDARNEPEASGAEAKVLKFWARLLLARRVIPTVRRVDSIVSSTSEEALASGAQIATALTHLLNGQCDAVVAFEENASQFRLRLGVGSSTAVTALYRSGDLNVLQETLRATWHWDRDPDAHCAWLGISPPNLQRRNERIIGAALAFESQIIIADQFIGHSLCSDLLHDQYCAKEYGDEWAVFQRRWAPKWFDSLCFILNSWRRAAIACGNTSPRKCEIKTAATLNQWNDVLWFFIARIERRLSKCLEGQVQVDIVAKPSGRRVEREEMHPRYIFASTRALQSDRGFDLLTIDPWKPGKLKFRYAEIASRTLYEARHSRNSWAGSGLPSITRREFGEQVAEWNPLWSTRKPQADVGVIVDGEGAGGETRAK